MGLLRPVLVLLAGSVRKTVSRRLPSRSSRSSRSCDLPSPRADLAAQRALCCTATFTPSRIGRVRLATRDIPLQESQHNMCTTSVCSEAPSFRPVLMKIVVDCSLTALRSPRNTFSTMLVATPCAGRRFGPTLAHLAHPPLPSRVAAHPVPVLPVERTASLLREDRSINIQRTRSHRVFATKKPPLSQSRVHSSIQGFRRSSFDSGVVDGSVTVPQSLSGNPHSQVSEMASGFLRPSTNSQGLRNRRNTLAVSGSVRLTHSAISLTLVTDLALSNDPWLTPGSTP